MPLLSPCSHPALTGCSHTPHTPQAREAPSLALSRPYGFPASGTPLAQPPLPPFGGHLVRRKGRAGVYGLKVLR